MKSVKDMTCATSLYLRYLTQRDQNKLPPDQERAAFAVWLLSNIKHSEAAVAALTSNIWENYFPPRSSQEWTLLCQGRDHGFKSRRGG